MKTHPRRFGNAKGVLLPSAVLAASGIGNDIELSVEAGRIVITSAKPCRNGWYEGYQAAKDVDAWGKLATTETDTEEW